ncbi:hypothetical protein HNY73_015665 [Argiope bruennichi]|uniref:Uncharacterized protein n=1 Tax=Argiope bruennichi TaxID=94029 RepID=A0A8T0EGQ4_ARGBR|nr:hypothetical protein HNY73_015665 [Argiope bruennichi]
MNGRFWFHLPLKEEQTLSPLLNMATNKENSNMALSESCSSSLFYSDDSDVNDNMNKNEILVVNSPLRNELQTSTEVKENAKNRKHTLSSRFISAKVSKIVAAAETTKQKKRKKRLAKTTKVAKQQLTEKHLNIFAEESLTKPLPKDNNPEDDNMESEGFIPGTPESQQGVINKNFDKSHSSTINDLLIFIAKYKLKANAAEELLGIFSRLVESFDVTAVTKRLETIERKVGITPTPTPPAQPLCLYGSAVVAGSSAHAQH